MCVENKDCFCGQVRAPTLGGTKSAPQAPVVTRALGLGTRSTRVYVQSITKPAQIKLMTQLCGENKGLDTRGKSNNMYIFLFLH